MVPVLLTFKEPESDEIVADGVVAPRFNRDLDLGSHAIRARNEHGLFEIRGNAKHSTEASEPADNAFGKRGLDQLPDAGFCRVRSIDIDSGAPVTKRVVGHAGSSSSNATSRRISRMR